MKKKVLLCAAVCSLILAMGVGCSEQSNSESSQATSSQVMSSTQSSEVASEQATAPVDSNTSNSKAVTSTLYIGSQGNFKEYPYQSDTTPTPDQLIQAIADKTGWNLTLADVTTSGKGGITVSFSKESALFTGPPKQQKDEFHMYDVEQLDRTILDSIQETLQKNIIDPKLGDPKNLNVFYCMEGDKQLKLPNTDVAIPMESPYDTQIWDQASNIKG